MENVGINVFHLIVNNSSLGTLEYYGVVDVSKIAIFYRFHISSISFDTYYEQLPRTKRLSESGKFLTLLQHQLLRSTCPGSCMTKHSAIECGVNLALELIEVVREILWHGREFVECIYEIRTGLYDLKYVYLIDISIFTK